METQYLFLILSALLILGLIIYSLWSARLEKSRLFKVNNFDRRPVQPAQPLKTTTTQGSFIEELQPSPTFSSDLEIEQQVKNITINLEQPSSPSVPTEPSPAEEEKPSDDVKQAKDTLVFFVKAPTDQAFQSQEVFQLLQLLGLQYGEFNIFHYFTTNSSKKPLFSVANMFNPGIFDLNQPNEPLNGLVFFMPLPSEGNGMINFELFTKTVYQFAQTLGGELLNENERPFQSVDYQQYLERTQAYL